MSEEPITASEIAKRKDLQESSENISSGNKNDIQITSQGTTESEQEQYDEIRGIFTSQRDNYEKYKTKFLSEERLLSRVQVLDDIKDTYFELGYLRLSSGLAKKPVKLIAEEFSFTVNNEFNTRYACDILVPIDISPGKKKFSFNVKKPKFFESDVINIHTVYKGDFTLDVFRLILKSQINENKKNYLDKADDTNYQNKSFAQGLAQVAVDIAGVGKYGRLALVDAGDFIAEHVMTLHHCNVESLTTGNFDGTKPVTEDISGIAQFVTFSPTVQGYYTAGN